MSRQSGRHPVPDAEHAERPAAALGEAREGLDERREGCRVADRIARDERDAGDDAIGDEAGAVGAEEELLVGAQRERRERVGRVLGDGAGSARELGSGPPSAPLRQGRSAHAASMPAPTSSVAPRG